jgi:hypothetical protein
MGPISVQSYSVAPPRTVSEKTSTPSTRTRIVSDPLLLDLYRLSLNDSSASKSPSSISCDSEASSVMGVSSPKVANHWPVWAKAGS